MHYHFRRAGARDADALAALQTAVADQLTELHGHGPWSAHTAKNGILQALRRRRIYVVQQGKEIVGELQLTRTRPWAMGAKCFSACRQALYLINVAVAPAKQHRGIGKCCLRLARQMAKEWPAKAIRVAAYAGEAGVGSFYTKDGFTEVGRANYRNVPLVYYERWIPKPRPA